MTDPLLNDYEVCAYLGCARSTLWRWSREGVVPRPLKIGSMSRWRQSEIDGFIAEAAENREAA